MAFSWSRYRQEWFGNVRADLIAGIFVALALIPEAISFSVIAGVDPKVGLYASFSIAVLIAFVGGRPAMISAATAAMAVLFVSLIKEHGLQYLFATTILTGILQVLAGVLRLHQLMQFVSRPVMVGFVNSLAILIFLAQVPELTGVPALTYPLVIAALVIIYGLPRVFTAIPSGLVAIVVLTIVVVAGGFDVRTVGDMGELPSSLPAFLIPDIPWTFETLQIILPYALALTVVGLLESLLTAQIVDDGTDTPSDKRQECFGQGIANVATGFFGGMAGCAMIGQSMINVRSGGRGRLSTFASGAVLLFLIVVLGDLVRQIPMAALVAVMIMVSVSTFQWSSIRDLRGHPLPSSIVMVATVGTVLLTHNLAIGVLTGVLLSGVFFAWQVAQLVHVRHDVRDGELVATVHGQVFFASTRAFIEQFALPETPSRVTIDVTHAHLWDISAVHALDSVVLKLRRQGVRVTVIGANEASQTLIGRHAVHHRSPDAIEFAGH